MNNLFAINGTDDNNPLMPADAYCRRRVDATLEQEMDAHADDMIADVQGALKSWPHFIGMGACGLAGVICFAIFDALTEGVEKVPATAWLWFAAAVVAFGLLLLVAHFYSRRIKSNLDTEEMDAQMAQAEEYARQSREELGIPEDAADIDVLGYAYEMKNGRAKQVKAWGEDYDAMEMYAFVQDGCLMLADAATLYAIPLSSVTAVKKRESRFRVYSWNKEEEPNKEPYKAYRIKYDDENDVFTLRAVYAIELAGADCELVVPDYEWERVLQPMTGLTITEEA